MGNDLGGGQQRTGKRLKKAQTANAPQENNKAMSEQIKWGGNLVLLPLALKVAAKRGEHGR